MWVEARADNDRWNLLDATAWIAKRDDAAVNVSQGAHPNQDALSQLTTALADGRLIADGLAWGFDHYPRQQIQPAEWLGCKIEIEPVTLYVHLTHGSFRPAQMLAEAKPKFEFKARLIPKNLIGQQVRHRHTRIMEAVHVSSVAVRELWPAAPIAKAGKRGRPAEYDWPRVKRELKARVTRGGGVPVDNSDLVFLIRDIFGRWDSEGGPADKTIRDAIKKYDLAEAAGMTGKKGMPQRRGK